MRNNKYAKKTFVFYYVTVICTTTGGTDSAVARWGGESLILG